MERVPLTIRTVAWIQSFNKVRLIIREVWLCSIHASTNFPLTATLKFFFFYLVSGGIYFGRRHNNVARVNVSGTLLPWLLTFDLMLTKVGRTPEVINFRIG